MPEPDYANPNSPDYDPITAAAMNNEEYDYDASGRGVSGNTTYKTTPLIQELQKMFPEGRDTDNSMSFIGSTIGESFDAPLFTRDHFFDFLSSWETGLPLQSLWACIFKIPNKVSTHTMKKWGEYIGQDHANPSAENALTAQGSVDLARKKLGFGNPRPGKSAGGGFGNGFSDKRAHGALGCMFAQTVGIPVEQSAISTVGPSNRGFIKGPIMEQRSTFAPLNIETLETNVSFNEFVLRPWAIMCQHEGLIARNWAQAPGMLDPDTRVTTDMMVINFGKTGSTSKQGGKEYWNTRGLLPRKIWMFTDCFPVNIGQERYSYTPDSSPDRRDTEWNFRRYEVMLPGQYVNTMDEIDSTNGAKGTVSESAKKFWKQHKKDFKSSRKVKGGFFGLFG